MKAFIILVAIACVGAVSAGPSPGRCLSIETVDLTLTSVAAGAACRQDIVGENKQYYDICPELDGSSCEDVDGETMTGTCSPVAPNKAGATCTSNANCEPNKDGADDCKNGKCRRNSGVGGLCTHNDDCSHSDLKCGTDGWCVSKLSAGDECDGSSVCPVVCIFDAEGDGTCGNILAAGADCTANAWACPWGQYCKFADEVGTCTNPDVANGGFAASMTHCVSGYGEWDSSQNEYECKAQPTKRSSGAATGAECDLEADSECREFNDVCKCAGGKKTICATAPVTKAELDASSDDLQACVRANCPYGTSPSRWAGSCSRVKCEAELRHHHCLEGHFMVFALDAKGDLGMFTGECSAAARVVVGAAGVVLAAIVAAVVA